jgi:hypothetical protein
MIGIAELFAELDGYDRYEAAVEIWASGRKELNAARREPARIYMRNRYRDDDEFRERKKLEMRRRYYLKRYGTQLPNVVDFRRPDAQHGEHRKYAAGCRCLLCKQANNRYQREWYRRNQTRKAA